jgi:hypothetical protein
MVFIQTSNLANNHPMMIDEPVELTPKHPLKKKKKKKDVHSDPDEVPTQEMNSLLISLQRHRNEEAIQ